MLSIAAQGFAVPPGNGVPGPGVGVIAQPMGVGNGVVVEPTRIPEVGKRAAFCPGNGGRVATVVGVDVEVFVAVGGVPVIVGIGVEVNVDVRVTLGVPGPGVVVIVGDPGV